VFAHRGETSSKTALPRAERLTAVAATVLVHALLATLLRQDGAVDIDASARDDALQVVWIERPPPVAQAATARPREPAPAPSAGPSSPKPADTAIATPPAAIDPVPAQPVVDDDAWSESPGRSRSLRDIDPSAFRRDPLARRDTAFDPPPARLEASIRDRSFGGWMQRATKARICGDLAVQLRRAPESAEAVIASMRRHGCKG
jgi:hypothetical protein